MRDHPIGYWRKSFHLSFVSNGYTPLHYCFGTLFPFTLFEFGNMNELFDKGRHIQIKSRYELQFDIFKNFVQSDTFSQFTLLCTYFPLCIDELSLKIWLVASIQRGTFLYRRKLKDYRWKTLQKLCKTRQIHFLL